VIAERVYFEAGYHEQDEDQDWLQSDDGGNHWGAKKFLVDSLVLDAQDVNRLYGIAPSSFGYQHVGRRSEDSGELWVNWAQQPCGLGEETGDGVLQLLADPTRTQVLYLRCIQGLFRTDSGGDSWTKLTSTAGQLLAMDYGVPGRILWGKDDGLWASIDGGESWQLIMPEYELSVAAPQVPLFLPSITTKHP
jgi:photosystem II stability/assembly factor-like uncharacterized protein